MGRVGHCGEVVSHRDASGDDPFHGSRKSTRGHAHDAWWVSKEHREGAGKSRVDVVPLWLCLRVVFFLWMGYPSSFLPQGKE